MIQDGLASSLLLSYSSSLLSSLDTALVWLSSGPGGGSRGGGGGAAAAVHVEATAATARDGAMHGAAVTLTAPAATAVAAVAAVAVAAVAAGCRRGGRWWSG